MPYNLDNWGGYPAAKRRLLGAAQRTGSNLIALTGDSHNAWAFDLKNDGRAAGVEFGWTSVTCPGMERSLKGIDPALVARTIVARNPDELRWVDASNRGYMYLTLTPGVATNEFVFVDTIRQVSSASQIHAPRQRSRGPEHAWTRHDDHRLDDPSALVGLHRRRTRCLEHLVLASVGDASGPRIRGVSSWAGRVEPVKAGNS